MISVGTRTCLLQTRLAVYSHQLRVIIQFMSGMLLLDSYVAHTAYDAADEITAAFSIAFNPVGNKIFAGHNKSIRVLDVHRPGRDFEMHSALQGNKEGQTGIISAVAFSPAHTGMLATGSYSQTTAIYREDNMELLYVLHGQQGVIFKRWKLLVYWRTKGRML
ncbi:uncharacterized protein LOC115665880 isoform X2 [Syzygium oleosum]|uniref:uncharacterized protein LOC115665880 isoform X2 n=1 Tax=Syzygium oleosum TaxID=219896 RepID=UPI0024BA509E|nr:uncharacterized protein LOC115665880 isoform X2 [Syzygium oleosum]